MLNARAVAVMGYGYGALALAERGYIALGVSVVPQEPEGGIGSVSVEDLRRARREGAETIERARRARQDADALEASDERAKAEAAALFERIRQINAERAQSFLPIAFKQETATKVIADNALFAKAPTAFIQNDSAGADLDAALALIQKNKLRDNQNRAAILLALLMD